VAFGYLKYGKLQCAGSVPAQLQRVLGRHAARSGAFWALCGPYRAPWPAGESRREGCCGPAATKHATRTLALQWLPKGSVSACSGHAPSPIAKGSLIPCPSRSHGQHRTALRAGTARVLLKPAHPLGGHAAWALPRAFQGEKKKEKKKKGKKSLLRNKIVAAVELMRFLYFGFLAAMTACQADSGNTAVRGSSKKSPRSLSRTVTPALCSVPPRGTGPADLTFRWCHPYHVLGDRRERGCPCPRSHRRWHPHAACTERQNQRGQMVTEENFTGL